MSVCEHTLVPPCTQCGLDNWWVTEGARQSWESFPLSPRQSLPVVSPHTSPVWGNSYFLNDKFWLELISQKKENSTESKEKSAPKNQQSPHRPDTWPRAICSEQELSAAARSSHTFQPHQNTQPHTRDIILNPIRRKYTCAQPVVVDLVKDMRPVWSGRPLYTGSSK